MKKSLKISILIMLLVLTSCKCDCSKEKKAIVAPIRNQNPPEIFGTLRIVGDRLKGDVYIPVEPADFAYSDIDTITVADARGIAIAYYDKKKFDNCDDDDETGRKNLHVPIDMRLPANWNQGNWVRVMCVNESDSSVFNALEPFFKARLVNFRDREKPYSEYVRLIDEWNSRPENEHKQVAYECNNKKFIPRYSKKTDGILTITKD